MTEHKTLACPFCGDEHFSTMDMTYMHTDGMRKGKRIKCNTCGAMAPDAAWNTRADTSLQSENTTLRSQVESLLAVIAAKDEALRKVSVADYSGNYRYREDAKEILAIKPSDVELVEVADNDCGSIKWTNEKWPHKCKLYALKQKEGE